MRFPVSINAVVAVVLAAGLLAAAGGLAVDRGGLLAWAGVGLAALLALKAWRWPSPRDTLLAVATIGAWVLAWGATWRYVVTTWESGEVVQLDIAGGHSARVWVFDLDDGPAMYYDAPPKAAGRLLAGAPLTMTRGGEVRDACADAARVQDLPAAQVADVLQRMDTKYAAASRATGVFYAVLGGRRDRVGLLVRLAPCSLRDGGPHGTIAPPQNA